MSRKVYTEIVVKVVFVLEEGTTIHEAIQEVDYSFPSGENFDVVDNEILEYKVIDSK